MQRLQSFSRKLLWTSILDPAYVTMNYEEKIKTFSSWKISERLFFVHFFTEKTIEEYQNGIQEERTRIYRCKKRAMKSKLRRLGV